MKTSWPIVTIMGPTGTGKTDLACQLFDRYPCHLISIDSAMIYRGMNIGTAKPDAALLQRYPHALVDILSPKQRYSVYQCLQDVQQAIQVARQADCMPVLVGGTMLYHYALQHGLHATSKTSEAVRIRIAKMANHESLDDLWHRLYAGDPVFAKKIEKQDRQRILRGLEMIAESDTIPSAQFDQPVNMPVLHPRQSLVFALNPSCRQSLYQKLNDRFDHMMTEGLLDEVGALYAQYGSLQDLPAFRCVGYKQLLQYVRGHCPLAEAVRDAKTATRRLAKRQITWQNKWQRLEKLTSGCGIEILERQITLYLSVSSGT